MKNEAYGDGMKIGVEIGLGMFVLGTVLALATEGQTAAGEPAPGQSILSASPISQTGVAEAREAVREIDDPHTGDRWMLMRGSSRPGGPGRLVLIEKGEREMHAQRAGHDTAGSPERVESLPVIHSGDRLVVEESTPVVEARLEAVALGPAMPGSTFNARLTIGGKVVRAVALAPGRAAFAPENAVRP
jgi:hypothetical protein